MTEVSRVYKLRITTKVIEVSLRECQMKWRIKLKLLEVMVRLH